MRSAQRNWLVAALAAGALGTAAVAFVPWVHVAYASRSLHVAVETAAGLVALAAAFLVAGRLDRTRRLADLLLALGLAVLAAANLLFALFPALLEDGSGPPYAPWAPLGGRLLGSAFLAWAALEGGRRLARPGAALRRAGVGGVAALLAVGGGLVLAARFEPGALGPADVASPAGPVLHGHPGILAAQGALTLLAGAAAVGFARRARGDGLLGWLAVALTLMCFANLNYVLFPTLFSEWVYVGDAFRVAAYGVILAGLVHEVRGTWRGLAATAVAEERRRLARDVHDGLAQELAFLVRHAADEDVPRARLESAAARALDESRRAIAALSAPLDRPLERELADAVEEVAHRLGGSVRLRLAEGVERPRAVREAVVRVGREAVANALRHGGVAEASVTLEDGEGLRLVVADTGSGFDPGDVSPQCFGLTSMRERVEHVGGRFRLRSRRGVGTSVEVVLP